MERPQPNIEHTLQETVSAVYNLVRSQIGSSTPDKLQEGRIASEKIDKGFYTLASVLTPSQIIGMVAREILLRKQDDDVAEANKRIRRDLSEIHNGIIDSFRKA